ncbi:hypothetical protein JM658_16300 [Joostella atrarenae]|uniref:Methylamine utilisation protein MauE domain-containing protein n=1 Tax=Joostella atrarenae TaxID=679257 RepID=A0ABS9J7M9_9FLAO|nr:hypothetical protein [Joostella atrarenae]
MKVRRYHIYSTEIICFLFVLLFSYAAISKLMDFELFRAQLGKSPLLTSIAGWVAWGIPLLELIIALALITPKFRLLACYGCLSLMSLFTMYIVIILNFTDDIPCACGGILETMGWQEHLIFNSIFIILATIGILLHPNSFNQNNLTKNTVSR